MSTLGVSVGLVILCVVLSRQIAGLLISPKLLGINYLSDLLLKQHGYVHGAVPRAALGRLIDMQLEIAGHTVGSGSLARKAYLMDRLPGLATQISEWIEDDPGVDKNWRRIFSDAGVPQRKRT